MEGVAEGVRQLAALFQKCLHAAIFNRSELFSRLKLQRAECARLYALVTQLEQARRRSESAWSEKDFSKLVEMLAPVQENLNPTELKKLEYAKKQIAAST